MKTSSKWLLGIGVAAAVAIAFLFVRRGVQGAKAWQDETLADTGWEWDGLFREPRSKDEPMLKGMSKVPITKLPFSITAIRNSVPLMLSPNWAVKYAHPAMPTTYYVIGHVHHQGDKMIAITPLGTGGQVG